MPLIKIFNYDTDSVLTYSFKMVHVKGAHITLTDPDDNQIHIYGKIIEVKGLN